MYDQILVPTDGSHNAKAAARHGCWLADEFDATVHILSVVDTGSYSDQLADLDETVQKRRTALEKQAQAAVTTVEAIADELSDIAYESAITHGSPYESILDYASNNNIELIVLGSHGRTGLDRLLLGSVTERVVRQSDAPVMTVPPSRVDQERVGCDSILLPTDGSAAANAAVDHGLSLADRFGATVHVLYIIRSGRGLPAPSDPERVKAREIAESVAEKANRRGIETETHVQSGTPHDSIRDFVTRRGIDLVTMGTHGRSGVRRYLLGSVTEKVLRTSDAPVITVRLTNAGPDEQS